MAASDQIPRSDPLLPGDAAWLTPAALEDRLEEEVVRAERQGTQLSCLLVVIENLGELARAHGSALGEQTLTYIAGALRRELRRYDRVGRPSEQELVLVLPGADGPRGEIVARRMLERLRTIKVEASGGRQPLRVSVGLAAWREEHGGDDLLARARAATQGAGEEGPRAPERPDPAQAGPPAAPAPPSRGPGGVPG